MAGAVAPKRPSRSPAPTRTMTAMPTTASTTTALHPRLVVDDGEAAIAFYVAALDGRERARQVHDDVIVHAEVAADGAVLTLTTADGQLNRTPAQLGGSPVIMSLEVADVDAAAQRFLDHGARLAIPIDDRDYGRRDGRIIDPFGHIWIIATPLEDRP